MPRLLLAALAALLAPAALAQTCSTEWTGGAGDDFTTDANWTNGAPTGGGVACIIAPGTYTVALRDDGVSTQSYGVVVVGSEGAGRQTLALVGDGANASGYPEVAFSQLFIRPNGGFDVYGGSIGDGTAIANEGLLRFASGGTKTLANTATITSTGTVEFDQSGLDSFTFQGSLVSEAAGTIRFRGPRARLTFDNQGHIISRGLLTSTGGSGGDFNSFGGTEGAALSFVNDGGRVEVLDGELRMSSFQGLRLVGGEYHAAANARLLFSASANELEGTLTGAPAGTVEFSPGSSGTTTTGDGAVFNFGGTGLRWTNSTLRGPARNEGLLVAALSTPTVGGTFTNVGRIEVESTALNITASSGNAGRLVNEAGGVIAFMTEGSGISASQGGRLVNRGRIVAEGGNASISSNVGGTGADAGILHDGGRLEATGGDLAASSSTARYQGTSTFVAAAGRTLHLSATSIEANGTLVGAGDGTFTMSFQGTAAQVEGEEGVFAFGGAGVTVSLGGFDGAWRNTGGMRMDSHDLRFATFTNEGTLTWTGAVDFNGGTFVNEAGASLLLGADASHTRSGLLVNRGLLAKTVGTGNSGFVPAVQNLAGGEIRVETGSVSFSSLTDEAGAVFSGTGRITPPSGFTVAGAIAPGNAPGAPGTLTWGRALAVAPSFVLDLDVSGPEAGTGYDRLSVTGGATLGGTAVLRKAPTYAPSVGTAFPGVLTATSVTGTFGTEDLDQGFALVFGSTAVDAVVTSPVGAEEGPAGETGPAVFAVAALSSPSSRPSVRVALPEAASLTVDVYDVQGRRVAVLAQGERSAGVHALAVSGLAQGLYVARVMAVGPSGTEQATQRLVVAR